ncbi:putative sulfate/bicarbonate/oxalate exchanger sat-1, partial [Operophtera brumata]
VAGGVVEKAILLTLLAGIVELLMGVLGLGFLVNFVSGPVSSGFTSAVALMIATSQVKKIGMIKLGEKSDDGPSTRQKLVTKCLWMVGTCRNAIVVVATGLLGYWFSPI